MSEFFVGQVIGRYELLFPVAKGGMAEVWAARLRGTRGFQKTVAIKRILSGASDDPKMQRMFIDEAEIASQIHHPNVVGILELGEHENFLYLVMEWVEGESLNFVMARSLDDGRLPLPIAVNLVGQACKGLHAAHELRDDAGVLLGVVHRDISAHNVLVTYAGSVKIVDFGVAKATARATDRTEAGELKGKFAYMAPEQILGEPIDRRADIFSMGVLIYLLTTGRHPFRGTSAGETLHNVCKIVPTSPSELVVGYPAEVEAVVMKALEKSPAKRFADANEMLAALERAMPESMEGSFEVEVAAYLKELLGQRASERRAQLRTAQEQADRTRPDPTSGGNAASVGSLRGISLDEDEPRPSAYPPSLRAPDVDYPPTHPSARAPASRRARRRAASLAAGVSACALVGAIASLPRLRRATVTASAPAEVPLAPGGAMVPLAAALATPSIATTVPADIAPSTAHEDDASTKDGSSKHTRRPVVTLRPISVTPPAASSAQAPAHAAPSPSAPPPSLPERTDSRANAWDPGSFGGRR